MSRMTSAARRIHCLVLISLLFGPWVAAEEEKAVPRSLFFVGNSYTFYNDLPGLVGALAGAAEPPLQLEIGSETHPGYSLDIHWRNQQERDFLGTRKWDVVVLQEQSQAPLSKRARMLEHAREFDTLVEARGGRTVLYMTWAPQRRPKVIEALADAYREVGEATGARVAPVGRAWQRVQSERPDIVLYRPDGSHPDFAGTYLSACVLLATIFDLDPRGLPGPAESTIPAEDLAFLQTIAWETVGKRETP